MLLMPSIQHITICPLKITASQHCNDYHNPCFVPYIYGLSEVLEMVIVVVVFNKLYFLLFIYLFIYLLKILFIYFWREGKGGGKREGKINVWLPLLWPSLGTSPETQACALTGNRTSDPLVHSPRSIHWATPARAISLYFKTVLDLQKNWEGDRGFILPIPSSPIINIFH